MKNSVWIFMAGILLASFSYAHAEEVDQRQEAIAAIMNLRDFKAFKEAREEKIKIYGTAVDVDSSLQMQNQMRIFQLNNIERYTHKVTQEWLMETYPELSEEDISSVITAALMRDK